MEIQVTQDVMDSECDRLPTICGAYSIKREESPTTDVRVAGSHPATCSDVMRYEEIKTEKFDVLSIKCEDIPVKTDSLATCMDVLEYEKIKIEEFDIDKALLERERAAFSQPVGAGQVMSSNLTILCYEHLY